MNYIFKKNCDNNSETSSIYSNIFKSKKKDSIVFLNRYSNQFFYEKKYNVLEKTFFNRALFDYELHTLLMLNNIKLTSIVPEILDISDSKSTNKSPSRIVYNINGLISLREAFEKNSINFHYLINELLTFLKMIQHSKLLIGNLNIDTIYIRQNVNRNSKLKFNIIDFSKANFTDNCLDLDFQSLYISLNEHSELVSQKNLNYFDQEFDRYTSKRLSKESFTESIIELYNN